MYVKQKRLNLTYSVLCFSHKVIEQCESKISKLKEELVNTKEHLNRTCLEKDVLEQEKAETSKSFIANC